MASSAPATNPPPSTAKTASIVVDAVKRSGSTPVRRLAGPELIAARGPPVEDRRVAVPDAAIPGC
jgi:hypothetical protein